MCIVGGCARKTIVSTSKLEVGETGKWVSLYLGSSPNAGGRLSRNRTAEAGVVVEGQPPEERELSWGEHRPGASYIRKNQARSSILLYYCCCCGFLLGVVIFFRHFGGRNMSHLMGPITAKIFTAGSCWSLDTLLWMASYNTVAESQ